MTLGRFNYPIGLVNPSTSPIFPQVHSSGGTQFHHIGSSPYPDYRDCSSHMSPLPSPVYDLLSDNLHTNPDNNNDDDPNSSHVHHCPVVHDIGCHITSMPLLPTPTLIKEVKKLLIPHFNLSKMTWNSFAMKLHASLIECDLT